MHVIEVKYDPIFITGWYTKPFDILFYFLWLYFAPFSFMNNSY